LKNLAVQNVGKSQAYGMRAVKIVAAGLKSMDENLVVEI